MKKIISILLVCIMCISLCACGGDEKEPFLGTWEREWEASTTLGSQAKGDILKQTYELEENGTGKFYWRNITQKKLLEEEEIEWVLDNDVINISYESNNGFGGVTVREYLVYDASSDTLTDLDYEDQVFNREKQ